MSGRRWRGVPARWSGGLCGCLGLILVLGVLACGGQTEVTPEAEVGFATPEPTLGRTATATLTLTATFSRTPTARPTATVRSTRTQTPTPTASPTPTARLTVTPISTLRTPGLATRPSRPPVGAVARPSSAPAGDGTPLPANVNPLTGLVVDDPTVLERRPLAVKIGNDPIVRPQWGLALADVVYEHLSEAGITRFTAVFWSRDAARIGGVRSARFIDLEIPAMYQSLLAFSGVSPGLIPKFQSADFRTWQISPDPFWRDPGFYRDTEAGLGPPYNLFTSTDWLWAIASERGVNQRPDLRGLTWQVEVPSGGTAGAWLEIPFVYRPMRVRWEYDAERGVYERSQGGEPHLAAETGEPLVADNVAVFSVHHVTTDIVESRGGARSIQIQLWGTGPAVLFRDGQAYEGLWARGSRSDMVVLRDPAGQVPLDLRPGSLWVQLVPLDMRIDYGR
jgi:hypothetical protein